MKNLKDNELVEMYKSGNEIAFNVLFNRHQGIMNLYANKMYTSFKNYDSALDFNHHYSELSIAFFNVVETLDINRGEFKKRLHFYMRSYQQGLYTKFNAKCRDHLKPQYQTKNKYSYIDPSYTKVEEQIAFKNIIIKAQKELSKIELKVFNLVIEQYKAKEIAPILGRSLSGIYLIKRRIARKLKYKY